MRKRNPGPKILIWDIETSPHLAYTWGVWEERVSRVQLVEESRMLCWAARWLGDRKVMAAAEWQPGMGHENMVLAIHQLIEEADIIVAHNGDKFDMRIVNAEFLALGLAPPAPSRQVDTLKVAKRHFRMTWNRLDFLAEKLGVGRKMDTGGFELWKGVLAGDKKAQATMLKYNKQDVVVLEDVYLKLRPWIDNHPNVGLLIADGVTRCPHCGSESLQKWGFYRTQTGQYQRHRCNSCGATSRGRKTEVPKEVRDSILVTARRG